MITSFGSDGSDSEDENGNSSDEKRTSTSIPVSGTATSVSYSKSKEIGPVFCQTQVTRSQGTQSPTKNTLRSYKVDTVTSISATTTSQSEESVENRAAEFESSNSTVQEENEFSTENKSRRNFNVVPKLDISVSLVPGYGDDSDGEEEIKPKQEIKPLFPISQDEDYSMTSSLKDTHSIFSKTSSNIQSPDHSNDNSGDVRETKNDHEKTEEKESKTDEVKPKTNIFLEEMQACGKAFQRKKRIAFDGKHINYFHSSKFYLLVIWMQICSYVHIRACVFVFLSCVL